MQFSVDARAISGSSRSAQIKAQCQPMLPAIQNVKRQVSGPEDKAIISQKNRRHSETSKEPNRLLNELGESPAISPRMMAIPPTEDYRKPTGMSRAKTWSLDVENSFRYQLAGFQDINEYVGSYGAPEIWPESGFIKCLQSKKTGYFLYFRQHRECEDKYLNRVKIYTR